MDTKLPLLFLFSFMIFTNVSAQYTEMINTNHPGGSQGAFSVGTNVLQVEAGFSYGKEKHNLLLTETDGMSIDYMIRYGFWKERLEFSFMGEFQSDQVTDNRSTTAREYSVSNFKSNTLGVKYLVYDPYRKRDLQGPNLYSWKANNKTQWADLIPAISLYVGANFDYIDDTKINPFVPKSESIVSPKFVLSTQNNFIGGWVFVTNIIVDRVTSDFPTYGYIITLTHATNRWFSLFAENQGFMSDFYADQLLRGGAATLINKDFQVDLSLTYSLKDTPSKFYGRVGVAYRLDMHKKDEFLEDKAIKEDKKKEKDAEKEKDKKQERQDGLNLDEDGE